MTNETWKPIPDFPGYEVSDHGKVRSYYSRKGTGKWHIADKPQRILNPGLNPQGYRFVGLSNGNGNHRSLKVARLVMLAFVGPRPTGKHIDICHNDGSRTNDNLENLRYDTRRENQQDRIWHGRISLSRYFTEAEVIGIRNRRALGMKLKDLATMHNTNAYRISLVCTGRTYARYSGPLTRGRPK